MKPSWDDAPSWAAFLVMDSDGEWKWHENRPTDYRGHWVSGGLVRHASWHDIFDWETSMEFRP